MDGTPQLLTDVKFSQHRRGYDPDEVDNFLERVSAAVAQLQDKLRQATERAELADSQVAEARRLQAEAEARAGDAEAVRPVPVDADAELTKVLVLAQRAADQALEEANANATRTVADARAKSLALLAEAEVERDRMLTKAREKADTTAEERAKELRRRVEELESVKADLQADVATLEAHMAAESERLRGQLDEIREAIDDPNGLRMAAAPALLDPTVPDPDPDEELVPLPAEASGSPLIDLQEGPGPDDETAPASGGVEPDADYTGLDVSEGPAPADGSDGADGADTLDAGAALDDGAPAVMLVPLPGAEDEAEGTHRAEAIDLTDPDDVGLPTELFTADLSEVSPSGSPLGEPDEAADAAMRAFFEQDLDEDTTTTTPKPRFGRRR